MEYGHSAIRIQAVPSTDKIVISLGNDKQAYELSLNETFRHETKGSFGRNDQFEWFQETYELTLKVEEGQSASIETIRRPMSKI